MLWWGDFFLGGGSGSKLFFAHCLQLAKTAPDSSAVYSQIYHHSGGVWLIDNAAYFPKTIVCCFYPKRLPKESFRKEHRSLIITEVVPNIASSQNMKHIL